ncbi:hypothetical protein LU699_15590 [Luteimonas fraxinea]|uniref:hypothetical protein n=1 Tax=Luteimonas fraxinea TaxID=2901869 RepID=UPI001E5FB0B9|nr:hypothetical protein [Luteimonas fraxinea]UHH09665.1 hypothetical protein LU699_15590 [Luteimonas fraxinea]
MTLLELLRAANAEPFRITHSHPSFHDVVDLLHGQASGALDGQITTMWTPEDGVIPVPAREDAQGLTLHGRTMLESPEKIAR